MTNPVRQVLRWTRSCLVVVVFMTRAPTPPPPPSSQGREELTDLVLGARVVMRQCHEAQQQAERVKQLLHSIAIHG